MRALGVGPEEPTYARLVKAYAEPHRHYHTAAHVGACLRELDGARDLAEDAREVEVALWFHDAVYSTTASDNESRSAAWAVEFLTAAGVRGPACERVRDEILATRHEASPPPGDCALVVDIDLSILGKDPPTFAEFETNIRKEYRWVPSFVYRRKRAEILQSFLDRPSIYALDHFRSRYEEPARANLRDALRDLAREAG